LATAADTVKNQDLLLVVGNGGPGATNLNTQNTLDYGSDPSLVDYVDATQSNTVVVTNPGDISVNAGNSIKGTVDNDPGRVNAAQNIWGGARSYQGSVAQFFGNQIILEGYGSTPSIGTAVTSQAITGDAFSDKKDALQIFANVLEAPIIKDADSGQLIRGSAFAPRISAQGALNSLFDENGESVGAFAQQIDLTSVAVPGTSVQAAWNRAGVGHKSDVAQALNAAANSKNILQNLDNDARINDAGLDGPLGVSNVVQETMIIDIGTGGGSAGLNSWQTINGKALNSLDTQQKNWARVVGQFNGIDATLVNEETAATLSDWINVPGDELFD
jgi:hypothetical protein